MTRGIDWFVYCCFIFMNSCFKLWLFRVLVVRTTTRMSSSIFFFFVFILWAERMPHGRSMWCFILKYFFRFGRHSRSVVLSNGNYLFHFFISSSSPSSAALLLFLPSWSFSPFWPFRRPLSMSVGNGAVFAAFISRVSQYVFGIAFCERQNLIQYYTNGHADIGK